MALVNRKWLRLLNISSFTIFTGQDIIIILNILTSRPNCLASELEVQI